MSDLTLYLAGLGLASLAAIGLHGWWLSRRAGPKRPEPGGPPLPREEPTFGDTRPLPLGEDGLPLAQAAKDTPKPLEDVFVPDPLSRRLKVRLDPLIDSMVSMILDYPLSGEAILAAWPHSQRAGSKPFFIEAQNAESGEWEMPVAGGRYVALQAGVQLVNRLGAINEIEYSEFVQKIQTFMEQLATMGEFPDMVEEVARARELDAFAAEHDGQLALRVVARGAAWTIAYVQQQAARLGFIAGVVPGRMVLPGAEDGDPPILSIQYDAQLALSDDPAMATIRDLALCFDVPQTDALAQPFVAWQTVARQLAAAMDAHITDDRGQLLDDAAFLSIEGVLVQIYRALDAHELSAGTPLARRLYS